MISIICPTNNFDVFNSQLKESLDKQNYRDFEVIPVDTNNRRISAVDALIEGAKKANGEYLLFCHHDLLFEEDELGNIIKYLSNIGDFGVVGVAGVDNQGKVIGNVTNGVTPKRITSSVIDGPVEVQTLDEMLFIVKREVLSEIPFDKRNETWHLYAVDYSLSMKLYNKKVYVIPSDIYHKSAGYSMNRSYYTELQRICTKYQNDIEKIYTTMGVWHTKTAKLRMDILNIKFQMILVNLKRFLIRR